MSINTTATTEVTFDTTAVTDVPTTDLVSSNAHCVDAVDTTSIVEGHKKEYSIVGDGIYASVSTDEAPEWLLDLIDNVVANSVANGLTDYDLLVQDVRNAIDALDIAKNTYVEQTDITSIVDGIVASHITTLNATYGDTFATKVELSTAVATATDAYTLDVVDLRAEFTDNINSRVTEITDAYAAADQVNANNIDVLTSVLTDQITGLSGIADAVSGLQTYVGLDYDGVPNDTGLLASITQVGDTTTSLQNQLDGKIEYYFYDSYAGVPEALTEQGALSIISSDWSTQELQEANNGSVVYFKDTVHAYWYRSSSNNWIAITDTSIYKALQDAASAQAAADGKVSQFYAWGGADAPADFTFDGNTIPGDNYKYWFKTDSKLYYKPVATWVLVPTTSTGSTYIALGDLLTVFSPDTLDYTNYSFNGTSWQQNGPNGIISKSKFFVDLENEVTGPTGHVATSLSNLQTTSETYANNVGAGVENKFSYDSTIGLNGTYYKSGFGLTSSGVTQPPGANGTSANPFSSKFWVNADNFTISDAYGAANPVFSVDTLTRDVVFNGKVIFTSGGTTQVGTIDEAITTYTDQISLDWDSLTGKDSLAVTLGYDNYAAMITAATNGTTVINGGYLNTSLIDADAITATMIDAKGLTIKDSDGNVILNAGTNEFLGDVKGTIDGTSASGIVTAVGAAQDDATSALSGLDNKLNSNARNILAGPGGLATGSLSWDENGNYTGGVGLGITSKGIAAYTNVDGVAVATFGINGVTGDAAFAGTLYAADGTFEGTLTANAINAVNTINIQDNAVTVPSADYAPGIGATGTISISSDAPNTPVVIVASFYYQPISWFNAVIKRDGVVIYSRLMSRSFSGINPYMPITATFIDTPGQGSHTYTLSAFYSGDSTGSPVTTEYTSLFVMGAQK